MIIVGKDFHGKERDKMKRILVFGMYESAMYHPLAGVDAYLKSIMPDMEFTFTEQILDLCDVGEYDGVISYWDDWKEPIPKQASEALYQYVEQGGSLLVLHNGISIQLQEPLKKMVGGSFITHPQQEEITFVLKENPLTKGCNDFALVEEPYQFELEKDDKDIFMSYIYRNKEYPAGWQKGFGRGEVIYLTPGHTPEQFHNEEYTKLIKNCMRYLFTKE